MRTRLILFSLALVPLAFAVSRLPADELKSLSGKNVSGTLMSIDEANVVISGDGGAVSTPLAQTLAVDIAPVKGVPAGAKYTLVRLIDDSVLHCAELQLKGDVAQAELLNGVKLKFPVASIASFLRDANDPALRKAFDGIAHGTARSDQIVILKDGLLNPIAGIVGDVDAQGDSVPFKLGAKELSVKLAKLHGIVYFRPGGSPESPICKVYDQSGNILAAVKVAYKDKAWTLTPTFGGAVPYTEGAIAKLDFNMGKLTYLSDLEPSKVFERSAIGLVVKHRKDQNLDGEPILIDRRYTKGLSMHAHTELEYDLAGKYKDLKGTFGIDIRTGADSQPTVSIFCDGVKRFSEVITPKAPRPINLNVKDVTTLKIVVSSRNELDLHDHVSFVDARVSQ